MRTLVNLLVPAILAVSGAAAQSGVHAEVKAAEDAWINAIKANDQAALERLLAPKLVYTHSSGLVENKAEYMKAVSSFQKYTSVEYQNPVINVYGGDTAIVTSRARMVGSTKGVPFDNQLLIIHVWVKENGRWQLAAHQTTRLPQQ